MSRRITAECILWKSSLQKVKSLLKLTNFTSTLMLKIKVDVSKQSGSHVNGTTPSGDPANVMRIIL